MLTALLARTLGGLTTLNTLIVPTFPVRFQIAPGDDSGLGISGAKFDIFAAGQLIASGTTDATGEVPVPLAHLFFQPSVVVRIFDTDYSISLGSEGFADSLAGLQKRLDVLGYMTGYQLGPIGNDRPDDNLDGPRTQQSIMNFQTDHNLAIDGVIGPETESALRRIVGG